MVLQALLVLTGESAAPLAGAFEGDPIQTGAFTFSLDALVGEPPAVHQGISNRSNPTIKICTPLHPQHSVASGGPQMPLPRRAPKDALWMRNTAELRAKRDNSKENCAKEA